MKKKRINAYGLLEKIRKDGPVVHHLTNWVSIYDCANAVKVFGASPVMAHAPQEAAEMAGIASALVLNIGTLTEGLVEAMKIAALSANKKGIPVVLDACGAGATGLRDKSCFRLLDETKINIIKGNASEMARLAGRSVRTKGVDSAIIETDLKPLAGKLAGRRRSTVVITGKEDVVSDGSRTFIIKNGHSLMSHIVGTGCMAASVIGAFAAVEDDLAYAAAAGLVCFEVAAECAAKKSKGPGTFKGRLYDCMYALDKKTVDTLQRVYVE
ncbi:MAG: hydroxyethylthiazole kinase [Candidatus Omnitrophica bacterium]|nr:hydroxyethylthiazole kinase [Candidatus Omnitrophota bacterium]